MKASLPGSRDGGFTPVMEVSLLGQRFHSWDGGFTLETQALLCFAPGMEATLLGWRLHSWDGGFGTGTSLIK